MAAGAGEGDSSMGLKRFLAYAEDHLGVLRASTDGGSDSDSDAQACDRVRMRLDTCRSECDELELQIKEYQEDIDSCKEKIEKAKEPNALEIKLEEKMQEEMQLLEELRVLQDELDDHDRQRACIKERRTNAILKKKKDNKKAVRALKMCLSVTSIVPDLEEQDKVSGYIVGQNRKKEKFEFENTTPPVETCDELWKKI